MDHLFEDLDSSNPDVFNLFMKMDDNEIQEFVRVVDLYYSDLMVEGDLTPIKKILLKYGEECLIGMNPEGDKTNYSLVVGMN